MVNTYGCWFYRVLTSVCIWLLVLSCFGEFIVNLNWYGCNHTFFTWVLSSHGFYRFAGIFIIVLTFNLVWSLYIWIRMGTYWFGLVNTYYFVQFGVVITYGCWFYRALTSSLHIWLLSCFGEFTENLNWYDCNPVLFAWIFSVLTWLFIIVLVLFLIFYVIIVHFLFWGVHCMWF